MPFTLPELSAPTPTTQLAPSPFAAPDNPDVLTAGEPSVIKDLALAPFRGALDFGNSVYNLADTLTFDALPDADLNFLGESKTTPGRIVEDVTEFALGFIPVAGVVGKLGQGTKLVRAGAKAGGLLTSAAGLTLAGDAVASGIAGGLFYNKSEERLSSLIQRYPSLQNPITEFLSSSGDEGEIEGRFKNALEQAGLSFLIGGPLILAIKGIKAGRNALLAGGTEEAAEVAAKAAAPAEALETAIKSTEAVPAPKPASAINLPSELAGGDKELNDIVSNYMLRSVEENAGETGLKTRRLVAKMFAEGEDQKMLAAAAEVVENDLKTSRVVPDAVMLHEAAETISGLLETNTDNVLRYFSNAYGDLGSIKSASNILAHAKFVQTYSVAFRDAVEKGITLQTPEAWKALLDAKANYLSILKSFDKVRSGLGLNLRAVGQAELGVKNGKAVRSLLEMTEEDLAKQLSSQAGKAELEKIIYGMGDGKTAQSVAELSKFQRFMGIHNEYWINMGLLSAPKTGIANLIGNTFATLGFPAELAAGTALNKVLGKAGSRADTLTMRAALKPYALLMQQVGDSWGFFVRSFKKGDTPFETLPMGEQMLSKKFIAPETLGIKETAPGNLYKMTSFLGEAIRLPGRTMVAMDSFFKHLNSHAIAKTKLWDEAYKSGLDGDAAGAFVNERFKKLLESSGSFYNKDQIVKQLHAEGKELLKNGKINNLFEYIDSGLKKWQDEDGAIIRFAKDYAERTTYTSDLPRAGEVVGKHPDTGALVSRTYNYDSIGAKVDDFVNGHPIFKLALPFTKTPMNIMYAVGQRMIPNDSIPGLKSLHRQYFADLVSGDPFKVAMAEGRLVSGMAMVTSTMALAFGGKITGAGPINDNERKALQATGWQPYSFVVDNGDGTQQYISFQRLDPMATFFGLAADVTEYARKQRTVDPDSYTSLVAGMAIAAANNFTNKSYLSGVDQISNVLADPYRFFDKFARTRGASYVPNFIRSAVGSFGDDPYMREARTFADSVMKSVPGASGAVDVQRNLLGEPIERKTLAPGFDYVNPVSVSTKGRDFVMDEIARLEAAFSQPRSKQGDGLIDMLDYSNSGGQSAYDRYMEATGEVKLGGKTLRQRLERMIQSKEYQAIQEDGLFSVDSPRATMIRRVIGQYRDAAMKQTRKEFPDFHQDMRTVENAKTTMKRGGRVTVDDLMPLVK